MTSQRTSTEHDELPHPKKPTWWVYVLVAVIILIILQKLGCGPIHTEDKVEWLPR
jgi:hypothetical protein